MTTIIGLSHRAALAAPMVLQLLVGATVILSLAAIAVLLLRQRSAAWKHLVWGLATAALLVLPVLTCLLPSLGLGWQLRIADFGASSIRATDTTVGFTHSARRDERPIAQFAVDRSEAQLLTGDRLPTVPLDAVAGPSTSAINSQARPLAPAPLEPSFNVWGIVLSVWLIGVALGIGQFIQRRVSIARMVRGAVAITDARMNALEETIRKSAGVSSPVRLLCAPAIAVPVAVGCLRPVILLPTGFGQWSESLCRVVLSHELAHIRRRDVAWQTIARLACLVYWFHPLVWLANYRMRVEREFACDDAVLQMGESPRHYATQLVALVSALSRYQRLPEAAVAMAGCGSLEQRVGAILRADHNRTPVNPRAGRTIAAGALAIVFALSLISPSTSQNVSAAPEAEKSPPADAPSELPDAPPAPGAATKTAGAPPQAEPKPSAPAADPLRTPAVGKGFVIVPFLTDLQRNYNWSHVDAALYLLINGSELCSNDDTTLNMSAVDFSGLEAAVLAYYQNGLDLKGKRFVIRVVEGPQTPKTKTAPTTGASSILFSYLYQRQWTNKPNAVEFSSRNPDHPLAWDRLVADLSKIPTDEDIRREAGVGADLAKVFPIRTPLSRYFVGEPENAVLRNLKPCDEMTPDDAAAFPGLVKDYLSKLELGKPPVVQFVEDFGNSSSKGNKIAKQLDDGLKKNQVNIWGHTLWSGGKQHTTPFLLITVVDADNRPVENAKISATFAPELTQAVRFEREKDGRWSAHGLTGYEDFTLAVEAPGYQTSSQKLNLAWDTTKNLDVTLRPK